MNVSAMIAVSAISYLLGAIPVGVFAAGWLAGIDPRSTGSGNIGFTNVLRVAGKTAGLLTLIGDMGKGALAVVLGRMILGPDSGDWVLLAGGAAIVGHLYPIFLRFKGGKGVATALGVFGTIDPVLGASLVTIWLVTIAVSRTSSLAAIITFVTSPALTAIRSPRSSMLIFSLAVSALIIYRHADNIRRLLAGTEPKLGVRHNVG
jgi:glycerol-3-phosphate acyltransferase PlsY